MTKRRISTVKSLLVFAILGCLFGALLNYANVNGYDEDWRRLPSPKFEPVRLTGITIMGAIVTDSKGQLYECQDREATCSMIQEISPVSLSEREYLICNRKSAPFSFMVNTPINQVDCLQGKIYWGEPETELAVILDDQNTLWMWENTQSGFLGSVILLFMVGFWGIVGLGVGALFLFIFKRRS